MTESALKDQHGGDHYKKYGDYQPWEVLAKWLTPEELRGFMKGTVIAYLAREKDKGGDLDIAKALHTMQIYSELTDKQWHDKNPTPAIVATVKETQSPHEGHSPTLSIMFSETVGAAGKGQYYRVTFIGETGFKIIRGDSHAHFPFDSNRVCYSPAVMNVFRKHARYYQ